MNKNIKIILFYVGIAALLSIYFYFHASPVRLKTGVYMNHPEPVASIALRDNHGKLFTEKNLKGHWSLLFFGFSRCTTICPLTMQTLTEVYKNLSKSKKIQVIFVSVDPENDSLDTLNRYMQLFKRNSNDKLIALRAEMPTIHALQKQLHVKLSAEPMRHGTEILLINPEGKVQAYFNFPVGGRELLNDLKKVIN